MGLVYSFAHAPMKPTKIVNDLEKCFLCYCSSEGLLLTLGCKFQSNKSFTTGLLRANIKVNVKVCVIINTVLSGAGKTLNCHLFLSATQLSSIRRFFEVFLTVTVATLRWDISPLECQNMAVAVLLSSHQHCSHFENSSLGSVLKGRLNKLGAGTKQCKKREKNLDTLTVFIAEGYFCGCFSQISFCLLLRLTVIPLAA